MRMLLLILVMITCSYSYAQEQQADTGQSNPLSRWDPVNNERFGKNYVPFSITTLDGKQIDNNSIRGKVTFFTFWFENCAACLAEFDELNELYSHFKNDTDVVFVSVTFDRKEDIKDVLEKYKVTFPVATVPSRQEAHRMNYGKGFPSVVLMDRQGKIRRSGITTIIANDDNSSLATLTIDSAVRFINKYKSN